MSGSAVVINVPPPPDCAMARAVQVEVEGPQSTVFRRTELEADRSHRLLYENLPAGWYAVKAVRVLEDGTVQEGSGSFCRAGGDVACE